MLEWKFMAKTESVEISVGRIGDGITRLLRGVDPSVLDIQKIPFSFMGKAARARFSILLGDALGLKRRLSERVAEAAELTHTASLLHDDCVDRSSSRRGRPTLNSYLGFNKAVLAGDLVVSLAFERASAIAPGIAEELVNAVRRMTEGALLEENSKGRRLSERDLERLTALKTGALFRWCALSLARLAKQPSLLEPCARLGEEAGVAFQFIDDILDFESEAASSGKDGLKDIFAGKHTLPLILALQDTSSGPEVERHISAFSVSNSSDLASAALAAEIVKNRGFLKAARDSAKKRARTSLFPLIKLLPERESALKLEHYINALLERTA